MQAQLGEVVKAVVIRLLPKEGVKIRAAQEVVGMAMLKELAKMARARVIPRIGGSGARIPPIARTSSTPERVINNTPLPIGRR